MQDADPEPRIGARLVGQFLAALAVVLSAAACSDRSPEERFAEKVCSTLLPRATQTLEVLDDVVHTRAVPGRETWITLAGFTDRGAKIAQELHAEIIIIPAPDTDDGRKAKDYIIDFGRIAVERMTEEKRLVRQLPRNLTLVEGIRALEHLELTLSDAFGLMKSVKGITTAQVPDLEDAFERSDSCRELDSLV